MQAKKIKQIIKTTKVYTMKQGIHPAYYPNNVTLTDGSKIIIFSSQQKDLVLSEDHLSHSAWTGQRSNVADKGQRAKQFKIKFDGFKF